MKQEKSKMPVVRTRLELAKELGVSYTTLYRWLKKHAIQLPPGLITPSYLEKIYVELGFPLPEEYQSGTSEKEE